MSESTDPIIAVPSHSEAKASKPSRRELRRAYQKRMYAAARTADVDTAFAIYDEMVKVKVPPNAEMCNIIFSICSRGAGAVDKARVNRAMEVFYSAGESSGPPDEAAYSSIIRLCCLAGDISVAMMLFEQMLGSAVTLRVRTYSSLLMVAGDNGDARLANALEESMTKHNLEPTQVEYAALLTAYYKDSALEHAARILTIIVEEFDAIEPILATAIVDYFGHSAPRHTGKGTTAGGWGAAEVDILEEAHGRCPHSGIQLRQIHPTADNVDYLISSIKTIGDTSAAFKEFTKWLTVAPPGQESALEYDTVIDGANVGFYGQNYKGGALMYSQIDAVVRELEAQGRKVLLILAARWLDPRTYSHAEKRSTSSSERRNRSGAVIGPRKDKSGVGQHRGSGLPPVVSKAAAADSAAAAGIVARWTATGRVYPVARGVNDDLFWLYAAMRVKDCILVTNDTMRDHHFQIVADGAQRTLTRWRALHQASFGFVAGMSQIEYPLIYSKRSQCNNYAPPMGRQRRVWHFPLAKAEDTWLVIKE